MSAKSSGGETDWREPGIEVGVAERAFTAEEAPLSDAGLAVGVLAGGEDRRGPAMEVFEADWTGLPSDRRRNYSPEQLRAFHRLAGPFGPFLNRLEGQYLWACLGRDRLLSMGLLGPTSFGAVVA